MNLILTLILSGTAGAVLGYFYFRGLWWTVERMPGHRNPYALALASFVIRTLLVMAGFYLLLEVRWEALAVGLLGFFAIRLVAVRKWGLNPFHLDKNMEENDGV